MKNIWRVLRLLSNFTWRIVKVGLINSLLGAIAAITPYLLKILLDQVVLVISQDVSVATTRITTFLAIIIGVRIFQAIMEYYQEKVSDLFFLDVQVDLRKKVYSHLLSLAIDFYEENRVGEIIQKVNSGIADLSRWVSRVFEGMLEVLISLFFMLILLWILVPPIGLVMTIVFPLNLYIARYVAKKVYPLRKEWLQYGERAIGELTETLSQMSTIRSFANESYRRERFSDINDRYHQSRASQFEAVWRANFVRNLVNTAAIGGSLFLVTWGSIHGQNSVGDIFLVALYIQRLISNIIPLSRLISDTADVEGTCQRLTEILDSQQIIHDHPNAVGLEKLETIEFDQVSFVYPGKRKKVLDGVSFLLKKGETLALVGPSGVGKSTITKLLLRFYEPAKGQIRINGQPIEHFTQDSIRQAAGMVMQDVALFNDTIEENILFARPDATATQLKSAAKIAHADVFIDKLADKYQTLVGERGIKLSGGEKQRVAIARAVLKDPQLIILDEATSALDSQSEQYVQDGLRTLLKDRTAVIIAHRLSTVMRADKIIVLQNGTILEQGNHQTLLKRGDLYAKLFSLQSDSLKNFDLLPEQAKTLG